jgi:Nucleoside 2-deoxyribosyltransferase like
MIVVKPPQKLSEIPADKFSIFTAGSIEMGAAEDWQLRVEKEMAKSDIVIFNPRRNFWDTGWQQTIHDPNFREQVEWELEAMERVDLIIMNILADTKAPISLLELGLFGRIPGKMIVHCEEGFWRKGNVDVVCKRYGIKQVKSFNELLNEIKYLNHI